MTVGSVAPELLLRLSFSMGQCWSNRAASMCLGGLTQDSKEKGIRKPHMVTPFDRSVCNTIDIRIHFHVF